MSHRMLRMLPGLLALALMVTTAPVALAETGGEVPAGLEQKALAQVAAEQGVPEAELELLASATVTLPETAVVVYDFKIGHEGTDAVYQATLDADGFGYDLEVLVTDELGARYARYGAVAPDFHAVLEAAGPGDLFPVQIWVSEPFEDPAVMRPDPDAEPTEEDVESATLAADAARADQVAAAVAPVVSQLESMGYVTETDPYAPVVWTQLPASEILDNVGRWSEVLEIAEDTTYEPLLAVQLPAC